MKRLILLGGGHAHLHVLAALAREPMPGVQVVLVSAHEQLLYSGMVPGLVAGHYSQAQLSIDLGALCARCAAEFTVETAVGIDAGQRMVTLADGRTAQYDALSLDIGSTIDRDAIRGAREHALFVRPIEQFARLQGGVVDFAARKVLDLVVVGGGAAGFELAMAFAHRLGRPPDERARISLVAGTEGLLPMYQPRVQARAQDMLRRARITVLNQQCLEITASHVQLSNGARLACDVPLVAMAGSASTILRASGLQLDERGYLATGPTLQSLSHPEVFAAGDIASRSGEALPKSGVYAVRAGEPLAFNLRRYLAGGQMQAWQTSAQSLNLLSCGGRRAIAAWGDWSAQGRWVWWWKDWIDRRFVGRFVVPHGMVPPATRAA
jgi:pyridine nucleotide-disulfide oxidoreductase family protein